MYNITEIKFQNQQDCFSLMYLHLVQKLSAYCGRSAEGTVREAVRRMGADWGASIRKKHIAAGHKTNLQSLYSVGLEYQTDPRMHEVVLHESEEVQLWEVFICPLADFWNRRNAGGLGLWFCEEFQRGLVSGYTGGKGQMNLSKILTCPRDNHCRFSVYFRKANTEGEQRDQSFSYSGEDLPAPNALENAAFADGIRTQFIKLYAYLLLTAREKHGDEGIRAIAAGLRSLAEELVPIMKRHASNTLKDCDETFLKLNFPVSLNTSDDQEWKEFGDDLIPELMQVNLLEKLKKGLLSALTAV